MADRKATTYDYYVNGYTGHVTLYGDHTDKDIKVAIMDDLNIAEYEEAREDGSKFWERSEKQ